MAFDTVRKRNPQEEPDSMIDLYTAPTPNGQKHVIERYRLALDGTYMDAMYILEDPEYLARPMLSYRLLLPAPHLEMIYGECDEVNAGRWVAD